MVPDHLDKYHKLRFGYTENTRIPAAIGAIVTSGSGATKSDLIFATRNSTVNTVAPTERMRMTVLGIQLSLLQVLN